MQFDWMRERGQFSRILAIAVAIDGPQRNRPAEPIRSVVA